MREKEILQTIFDHIPLMITFIGADGRVKLVNREWVRTFGWSAQQVQNQKLDILTEFYPDPIEQKRLFDFVANSQGQWTEFRPRLRDGRIITDTSYDDHGRPSIVTSGYLAANQPTTTLFEPMSSKIFPSYLKTQYDGMGRTIRWGSSCIRTSRSFTAWAASLSKPATGRASIRTGSA